jgi:NADH-quinone oxidoreductase subunit L
MLIGLMGFKLGRETSIFLALLSMCITLCFSLIILYEILLNQNIIVIDLYNLLIINEIKINVGFSFDSLTSIMLIVVISISTLVHIFTAGYMSHDPFIIRFYTYLGLFTFFMVILITSDNFLQLFVG